MQAVEKAGGGSPVASGVAVCSLQGLGWAGAAREIAVLGGETGPAEVRGP